MTKSALLLPLVVLAAVAAVSYGEDCPFGCQCSGSTVDCSGKGLTRMPAFIPRSTTHL